MNAHDALVQAADDLVERLHHARPAETAALAMVAVGMFRLALGWMKHRLTERELGSLLESVESYTERVMGVVDDARQGRRG